MAPYALTATPFSRQAIISTQGTGILSGTGRKSRRWHHPGQEKHPLQVLSPEDTLTCTTVRGCPCSGREGCLLKQGKNYWKIDHGCPIEPLGRQARGLQLLRHVQLMKVVQV